MPKCDACESLDSRVIDSRVKEVDGLTVKVRKRQCNDCGGCTVTKETSVSQLTIHEMERRNQFRELADSMERMAGIIRNKYGY